MSLLGSLRQGGWLREVDHALALSLRHAREQTPDLVQAAAALASRALGQGHSRLPLSQLPLLFAEIDSEREPPGLPALEDWLDVLAASPWVQASTGPQRDPAAVPADRLLVLEGDALSLRRYWNYEFRLARALRERAEIGPTRLQLLTGGPGTGKTTRVARLLCDFAQARQDGGAVDASRIALAAPTGKAAARLSESVRDTLVALGSQGVVPPELIAILPTEARTLHRLLGWRRDGFRHDREHPLAVDLVVVDEASMIDLPLMCRLLEAVPDEALLVLVGDRDQLPSVDTGDVLAALCEASERPGSALSYCRTHLRVSHRQAAGLQLAELADRVRDGEADAALRGLAADAFAGVRWRTPGERGAQDALIAEVVPCYRALRDAPDPESALRQARDTRVLCAVREGPFGSQTVNALVGQALDPLHGGDAWFRGRLVLVTENSYRQQLFNGDIGVAWPDEQGEMRVWFEADGGPRALLPAALPAHEAAFALTVHKSQGSEFGQVWLLLPEHGRVLSRELLYTGMTRCRQGLQLWASEAALREAIGRRAQRWSGLAQRV